MRDSERQTSFAVSVVGWVTMLIAIGYAVAAGVLLSIGVAILTSDELAKPTGWEFLGWLVAAAAAVLGILFAIHAVLGFVAGLGVVLRHGWGRVLSFIVAPFTIAWGVLFVLGSTTDSVALALGLAQIAYGLFAILVLATNGGEFRGRAERRRGRGRSESDRHAELSSTEDPR